MQRTRGYLELLSGNLQTARTWLERGLAAYQQAGDQHGVALSLSTLGRARDLSATIAELLALHSAPAN